MKLVPIVEGRGDVDAAALLLRRILHHCANAYTITVARPIRQTRHQLANDDLLTRAIQLALFHDAKAVLVLFDADTDCPRTLGPTLEATANRMSGGVPVRVVIANHEYEAWFLGGLDSLRSSGRIRPTSVAIPDPDSVVNAKGSFQACVQGSGGYSPRVDQARFTSHLDIEKTAAVSRSFRRMISAACSLASQLEGRTIIWPPPAAGPRV